MTRELSRRQFVTRSAALGAVVAVPASVQAGIGSSSLEGGFLAEGAPSVRRSRIAIPVVISDISGYRYRNGGPENSVERAFRRITEGEDVLDALMAGVNIPELDPEESGIGFGGLPNADGTVQLDACCMHGPRKQAGGVAALEGVRTPSLVARAVMANTDHHLLVGKGAQDFARQLGFTIEDDLNTPRSRERWLEWKRRIDPDHFLDPEERVRKGYEVGLQMVREGLLDRDSFWGTTNCNGINAKGEICGVTTTSGLAWKIPGRVGDSPILGAGLYVDGDVGAAGSTGRGEANLYNLSSFLIVENLRRGMHPKDAGMEALRRIQANTVEARLLTEGGLPNFDLRFFILNKKGEYAGVALYGHRENRFALCTEKGSQAVPLEGLLEGSPYDS
ncbi:MAG: N(4)-(beta-N-acetylglucosaminyl)-L-asparaginase [Gemmatimonadota bacterium]